MKGKAHIIKQQLQSLCVVYTGVFAQHVFSQQDTDTDVTGTVMSER